MATSGFGARGLRKAALAAILAPVLSGAAWAQDTNMPGQDGGVAFVSTGTDGHFLDMTPHFYISAIDGVPTGSPHADLLGRVPGQDFDLPAGPHRFELGTDLYGVINRPLPILRTVEVKLQAYHHYRFDGTWPLRSILFEEVDASGKIVRSTELSRNQMFYGAPGSADGTAMNAASQNAYTLPPQSAAPMSYDAWLKANPR